jgi:hypothetical protein
MILGLKNVIILMRNMIQNNYLHYIHTWGMWQGSWLKHYATSWKVMGSSPKEVDFLNLPNPSTHNNGPGVNSASNRN